MHHLLSSATLAWVNQCIRLPEAPLSQQSISINYHTLFQVSIKVFFSSILEATANVNIPIENGMLSIRPTEMDSVDASLVRKIDPNVLAELKQLQDNLNVIMRSLKL